MAKKKGSFIKRHRILILLICIILAYFGFTFVNQELKIKELKEEEKRLQAQVDNLNKKIKVVEEKIEKVDSKEFVEKEAREKLKMVKENEIIYIIQDSKGTN